MDGHIRALSAAWRVKGETELVKAIGLSMEAAAAVAAMRLHCADELDAALNATAGAMHASADACYEKARRHGQRTKARAVLNAQGDAWEASAALVGASTAECVTCGSKRGGACPSCKDGL